MNQQKIDIVDTNNPRHQNINSPLAPYDYIAVTNDLQDVRGEGNCFYHAVVLGLRSLGYPNMTSTQLRKIISKKLKELLHYNEGNKTTDLNVMFNEAFNIYDYIKSSDPNDIFLKKIEENENVDLRKDVNEYLIKYINQLDTDTAWGYPIDLFTWAFYKTFPNICIETYSNPLGSNNVLSMAGLGNCQDVYYDEVDIYRNPHGEVNDIIKNVRKNIIRIYNAGAVENGKGCHFQSLPTTKNTDDKGNYITFTDEEIEKIKYNAMTQQEKNDYNLQKTPEIFTNKEEKELEEEKINNLINTTGKSRESVIRVLNDSNGNPDVAFNRLISSSNEPSIKPTPGVASGVALPIVASSPVVTSPSGIASPPVVVSTSGTPPSGVVVPVVPLSSGVLTSGVPPSGHGSPNLELDVTTRIKDNSVTTVKDIYPEPKPGAELGPTPENKPGPEPKKTMLKEVLKPEDLKYSIDKTPVTVPNSLVIYLTTNVPGFQKIKFIPNMIDPSINKYVSTVFFDPIVPLNREVIKKTPKQLLKTQFFDKGLFFTLKNRTLTKNTDFWSTLSNSPIKNPYSLLKKNNDPIEKQLENSTNNGIIDNNIRQTIHTLFPEDSVIYLNNKPYTIYSSNWTSGDWKIDTNNNLPDFLSTGQYYGPYSSYQGGPASQSALNTHPLERFRQPTIYITNSSSNNQSSPLQIQNAEKQLNSIPRKLISGPTYNEKEFSNISTLHPKEWRLLPSGNKPLEITYPVNEKIVKYIKRNRYNPNLPVNILEQANQIEDNSGKNKNQLLIENDMGKKVSGLIEDNPSKKVSGLIEDNPSKKVSGLIEDNPSKKVSGLIQDNTERIEDEGSIIPVNPYYKKLLEYKKEKTDKTSIQIGGSLESEIRNFFNNSTIFYNKINLFYRNMNKEHKHLFEYIEKDNQIVDHGELPKNLRINDYRCNNKTNELKNIIVQRAVSENSFFDCISAGIQNYNAENGENKITCYKKSGIEDRIDTLDSDGIKRAVYLYFLDHPDKYVEYINNNNIRKICDKMNELFNQLINKPGPENTGIMIIPNDQLSYNKIIQEIYTNLSIKKEIFGIKIPTIDEYNEYDELMQQTPFEVIEIVDGDKSKQFMKYIQDNDFLVDDEIFVIIQKKYGIKVIIIEKNTSSNSYHIKNKDIILNTGDDQNYPVWNKYMFLLLDGNGHYDLLNFITRKSYWCYIKHGIKMTPTTIFSKKEQNYIWNVPPIYIIYLMFVSCFLPKLSVQSNITEFIQRIDLFKDDYIIFCNVYEKIKNDKGNEEQLGKEISNIEKQENIMRIQIKQLNEKLIKIEKEYDQEYNNYFMNIQNKYLNEIIKENPSNEKSITKEFRIIANSGDIHKNNDFFNKYLKNIYAEDYFINEIDKFPDYIAELDKSRDENKYENIHDIPSEIDKLKMKLDYINDEKSKLIYQKDSIHFTDKTFINTYNLLNNTNIDDPNVINNMINDIKNRIKSENIEKKKADEEPESGHHDGDGIGEGVGERPVDDINDGTYSYEKKSIIKKEKTIPEKDKMKEAPPPDGPPPPLDELDIIDEALKNKIIGSWKEVNYDRDPSKKYWWNEITNETTSIGAKQPTGLTATTPNPGFMSYDNPLKENSKTSFIVFVNLVLYPGTSIPESERRRLACYVNYEEIRRSYAELWDYEYIPIPMNDDKYYNLKNTKSKEIKNSLITQKNNTRRVTFDNKPPQQIQGGKNKTKRNKNRMK
uniref:OTU domain-containing protein n=1 Tax=viral metagenome TaxID=1070528 RepID=A0A6C0HAI0_9ZZZZ